MRRADQYVFDERNRRTPAQQLAAPAPHAPTPGPSTQPQTPQTSAGPSQRRRTTSTTTTTSQTQAPPRTNLPRNTSQTYQTTTTPQAPQLSPQASTSSQHAYRQAAPSVTSSSTAPTPSGSGRQSRRTQGEEPEYTGLDDLEAACHERTPCVQLTITTNRAYRKYRSVPVGDRARVPRGSRQRSHYMRT